MTLRLGFARNNTAIFAPAFIMKHCLLLLVSLFVFGCQPKPETAKTPGAKPAIDTQTEARKICYELVEGRSVAVAEFTFKGDSVTGKLDYLFAEKDQSRGFVNGVVKGDILRADYTYQSEGSTSVMEVIFKVEGDKIVQGHGAMRELGSKIVYVNPDKVEFKTPFKAKACQ